MCQFIYLHNKIRICFAKVFRSFYLIANILFLNKIKSLFYFILFFWKIIHTHSTAYNNPSIGRDWKILPKRKRWWYWTLVWRIITHIVDTIVYSSRPSTVGKWARVKVIRYTINNICTKSGWERWNLVINKLYPAREPEGFKMTNDSFWYSSYSAELLVVAIVCESSQHQNFAHFVSIEKIDPHT